MLVAASLALALVPALAYAQVTTATVQVTDGAQTTLIQTNLPQQFETRTIIFTAPVNQISSLAQAIPTSIQVVVSQPDGGFIPINLNGFSTSVFVPAAASVPTGVPLSPITPIFVPAPISTALSAASQSVASLTSVIGSALTEVSKVGGSASSLASVATATVDSIPTPNQISTLSGLVSVVSSNVAQATSVLSAASSKASAAVSNGSVLVASVVSGVSTSVLVASSAVQSGASILVDSSSSGLVTHTVSSTASTSVTNSGVTTASVTRTVASSSAAATTASKTSSTAAPSGGVSGNMSGLWESCILILAAGMVSVFFILS